MKVISIVQPWATLIALGEKKFETRSWATKHRGELAIHASKKVDKEAFTDETIYMTLRKHGILTVNDLPTGAIVAITKLTNCYGIEFFNGRVELVMKNIHGGVYVDVEGMEVEGNEVKFGWYDDGRFAWELSDTRQLVKPIPAKGQLGLWNYPQKDVDK